MSRSWRLNLDSRVRGDFMMEDLPELILWGIYIAGSGWHFKRSLYRREAKNERNILSRIIHVEIFKKGNKSSIPSRMERAEIRSENAQHSPWVGCEWRQQECLRWFKHEYWRSRHTFLSHPHYYNVKWEGWGSLSAKRQAYCEEPDMGPISDPARETQEWTHGEEDTSKIWSSAWGEEESIGTVDVTDKKQKKNINHS